MTIDITNGTRTRQIHFAPIFNDTLIYIRRKLGYAIIEQNDEIVDIAEDGEHIDDVVRQLKEFANPLIIVR